MVGDHIKARDACQKISSEHVDDYLNPMSLMGWINLTSNRSAFVEKSITNFDKAVDQQEGGVSNHTDALLGKVAYLDLKKNYSAAVHILNSVIASLPAGAEISNPVQIEKAKIMVKKGQWDQAADIVQKILKSDPYDVQALMVMCLYLLAEDSKQSTVAVSNLRELHRALEAKEPRTHKLYAFASKTLARLAVAPGLLSHTMALINKACELQPSNADYIAEKAYQLSLAGEWAKSLETFRQVLQIDDGNLGALHGIIRTQIMLGRLDDADQQLEFLNQMQIAERPAELCYLMSLMKWRKHRDQEASLESLDEAVAIHSRTCSGVPSYEFYEAFNPQLLLAIIREYLQHCPTEPVSATDPPSSVCGESAEAARDAGEACEGVAGGAAAAGADRLHPERPGEVAAQHQRVHPGRPHLCGGAPAGGADCILPGELRTDAAGPGAVQYGLRGA